MRFTKKLTVLGAGAAFLTGLSAQNLPKPDKATEQAIEREIKNMPGSKLTSRSEKKQLRVKILRRMRRENHTNLHLTAFYLLQDAEMDNVSGIAKKLADPAFIAGLNLAGSDDENPSFEELRLINTDPDMIDKPVEHKGVDALRYLAAVVGKRKEGAEQKALLAELAKAAEAVKASGWTDRVGDKPATGAAIRQ